MSWSAEGRYWLQPVISTKQARLEVLEANPLAQVAQNSSVLVMLEVAYVAQLTIVGKHRRLSEVVAKLALQVSQLKKLSDTEEVL